MKDSLKNGPDERGTISRKQEEAIAALLTHRTLEEAALAAGVGSATIWRWMQRPTFRDAYRAARMRTLETAISRLQSTTSEAVETLRRNLSCGDGGDEIKAAMGILSMAFKGAELLDLESRISDLEAKKVSSDAPMVKVS